MIPETIEWHYCTEQMPDDQVYVLFCTEEGDVDSAFHEGGCWLWDGLTEVEGVIAWAHVPQGPNREPKEGA
jgi:hypothetical protein